MYQAIQRTLFPNYRSGYSTGYSAAVKKTIKIFDEVDKSNIGVLYWKESTLKDIATQSGPLAVSNEFQIHYWTLVIRLRFKDNSIMDLTVPTVIFNYAQEVSSAHIDFELKDVNDVSTALLPIHNVATNKIIKQLEQMNLNVSDDYDVEYLSVPLNTMHRHPTGVSSFSGTDLRKDHEHNTGIVFPLKTAKETPSFSSIIYNNPVKMIHTEYRVATGDVDADEGINYKKGRCITYVKADVTHPSHAEQFLGVASTDRSYVLNPSNVPSIQDAVRILNSIVHEPNTQFVKAENLSEKKYSFTHSAKSKTTTTTTTTELVTVYDKETVAAVKESTGLTIRNFTDLDAMKMYDLKLQALPLEKHYYASSDEITIKSYDGLSNKELVELIMEIQDNIIEELEDPPFWNLSMSDEDGPTVDIEEMKEMLLICGAPLADIDSADDVKIKKWYEELNIPA